MEKKKRLAEIAGTGSINFGIIARGVVKRSDNGGTAAMKYTTYKHGIRGVKWGIWNRKKRKFQFGICEDTPMLAEARLFQKIGDNARKWRFVARQLPEGRIR